MSEKDALMVYLMEVHPPTPSVIFHANLVPEFKARLALAPLDKELPLYTLKFGKITIFLSMKQVEELQLELCKAPGRSRVLGSTGGEMSKCAIVGESQIISLLVRYNGIGKELTHDEKEILMFALYNESETREGLAMQARMKCESIWKQQQVVKAGKAPHE